MKDRDEQGLLQKEIVRVNDKRGVVGCVGGVDISGYG